MPERQTENIEFELGTGVSGLIPAQRKFVEGLEAISGDSECAEYASANKLYWEIFLAWLSRAGRGKKIMSMSDPIADMLTRIRNATMRQHETVALPHSKSKEALAKVLMDEGYIEEYQILPSEPQPVLRLKLKYVGDRRQRRSVIGGLKRVSKPGRRVYVGKGEIPWIISGLGVAVLTTSKGVMTGQEARRLGIGGEVICEVW